MHLTGSCIVCLKLITNMRARWNRSVIIPQILNAETLMIYRVIEIMKAAFLLMLVLFAFFISGEISVCTQNAVQNSTLNPIADSYVSSAYGESGSNFGGKGYMQVADSGNMYTGECLAFLKFDLGEISSTAQISSATLELHTGAYVTSTHTISVHYCTDDSWTELGISYGNHPSFSSTIIDSAIVASTGECYEWNVISCVRTTLDSDKVLTLVLSGDFHESADWVWFHSRDQEYSWMEEYRPKLRVYHEGEPSDEEQNGGPEIPGFPLEALLVGLVLGFGALMLLKKRRTPLPTS